MIFLASVEVEPLAGSEMYGRGIGAAVYCFIPANSERLARRKLARALTEDKYQIVNIEFVENYAGFIWDKKEEQLEYDKLAKRAALNNDVIYGPFYTWQE